MTILSNSVIIKIMRRTLKTIAVLLLLSGSPACGGDIPVLLSTTEQSEAPVLEPNERVEAVLDEAFEFWDLSYVLVDYTYGSIEIGLVEVPFNSGKPLGFFSVDGPKDVSCNMNIWVDFDGMILAHELGHAFSLDHVDDKHNVMNDTWPFGGEITETQWDKVQARAELFRGCRP